MLETKLEKPYTPFYLIAGPCSVESEEQMLALLRHPGFTKFIRGGIYKMRTSPSSFQGLRNEGIELIKKLKKNFDFHFTTEVSDPRQIQELMQITDVFQVGARNMYNYELLKELAQMGRPVLLKRAFSATLAELLAASEYLAPLGRDKILLCERGIRTFETATRNTLDLGGVMYLKKHTDYKVIVDPSHALGERDYILPAAYASLAAGADGLLVETHPSPSSALSDAQQAIDLNDYDLMLKKLQELAHIFDKQILV